MNFLRHASCLRRVLYVSGFAIIFLAMLSIKVMYHASQEFALGEQQWTQGELKKALVHYERTIKWYTPWSTVVQRAVERLWQLGTEAETRGDTALALEAYQTLRSSLYAVQSFYIPYASWIPQCEARIAPLLAQVKAGEHPQENQLAQDTARFAMQLQRHVGPQLGWSILLEVGFLGWVGATVGLIWYMVDAEGNFVRRQSVVWGSLMALFFTLWVIGMRLT